MGDDTQDFVKCCWEGLHSRIRSHTQTLLKCRACGSQCTWFCDMCENCGTKDPVMLPLKYLWAAALLAVVFLLLALWWL
jgi:hypothetical protein